MRNPCIHTFTLAFVLSVHVWTSPLIGNDDDDSFFIPSFEEEEEEEEEEEGRS